MAIAAASQKTAHDGVGVRPAKSVSGRYSSSISSLPCFSFVSGGGNEYCLAPAAKPRLRAAAMPASERGSVMAYCRSEPACEPRSFARLEASRYVGSSRSWASSARSSTMKRL